MPRGNYALPNGNMQIFKGINNGGEIPFILKKYPPKGEAIGKKKGPQRGKLSERRRDDRLSGGSLFFEGILENLHFFHQNLAS